MSAVLQNGRSEIFEEPLAYLASAGSGPWLGFHCICHRWPWSDSSCAIPKHPKAEAAPDRAPLISFDSASWEALVLARIVLGDAAPDVSEHHVV